jgi:hypothetical protein
VLWHNAPQNGKAEVWRGGGPINQLLGVIAVLGTTVGHGHGRKDNPSQPCLPDNSHVKCLDTEARSAKPRDEVRVASSRRLEILHLTLLTLRTEKQLSIPLGDHSFRGPAGSQRTRGGGRQFPSRAPPHPSHHGHFLTAVWGPVLLHCLVSLFPPEFERTREKLWAGKPTTRKMMTHKMSRHPRFALAGPGISVSLSPYFFSSSPMICQHSLSPGTPARPNLPPATSSWAGHLLHDSTL